jgi:hypothetical protein
VTQLADPNTHTAYNCFMLDEPYRCALLNYAPSVNTVYDFELPSSSGTLPDEAGSTIHDNLGKQLLNGLEPWELRIVFSTTPVFKETIAR